MIPTAEFKTNKQDTMTNFATLTDLQLALEQLYSFARSKPARLDLIESTAIPYYTLVRKFIAFNNHDQLKLATGDPYALVAEVITDRFAYAVKMYELRKRIEMEFKAPVESPDTIGLDNYIKTSCITTEELTFMADFSGSYTQVLIKRDKILPAIQYGRFWYIPIIPAVQYLKTRRKYPRFFKVL